MTSGPGRPETLRGHRSTRLGGSPFWATLPSITAAVGYALAAVAWVVAGASLPGGRWLAVHLFTLGVLTNVVLVFSDHFGRTLSKHESPRRAWYAPTVNLGIVMVLVGIPTELAWLVAVGALVVIGVVVASLDRLRTMVAAAEGKRFGWIPGVYLWAHGAFVLGALLGMLMGVGWIPAAWYAPMRLAHLHANVLGWGGLTVLATLVFFGPAIVRTRIATGADERAGRALRLASPVLFVGVAALMAVGVGGGGATAARLVAAAAFAVVAGAVTVTCWPVAGAARNAKQGATRRPVVAVATWFPVVAWLDVVVVATGQWRLLDAVGLAMFLGVLGQLIATVLAYLVPLLRSRGFAGRDRLLARFERAEWLRTTVFNLGVLAIVTAAVVRGDPGWALSRLGWGLLLAAVAWLLVAGLWPAPEPSDPSTWEPRSAAARRYRSGTEGGSSSPDGPSSH